MLLLQIFSLYIILFFVSDISIFDFDGNEKRAIFNFLSFIQPEQLSNELVFIVELKFSQVSLDNVSKIMFSCLECLFLKLFIQVNIFRKLSRNFNITLKVFSVFT